jgi:outer membrane protein OmpA-like peptidoglycan-associated protein
MKVFLVVMLSYLTIWSGVTFATQQGYVVDGSGQIVKTGTGLCLRNGTWTVADAVNGCDPSAEAVPLSLSGDVLFEFDSSALTSRGLEVLSVLAANIMPGSTVTVVGHTDRIGTAQYNLKLSQQRAGAVTDFLNAKSGFKSKFITQGVGATQPTEGTALCTGMRNFERFKSCLAPDRRVVITHNK